MTYTTRCPSCGTTFKVVPDQLKISEGWVRCGHCTDVFDATLYLQEAQSGLQPAPKGLASASSAATTGATDDGEWLDPGTKTEFQESGSRERLPPQRSERARAPLGSSLEAMASTAPGRARAKGTTVAPEFASELNEFARGKGAQEDRSAHAPREAQASAPASLPRERESRSFAPSRSHDPLLSSTPGSDAVDGSGSAEPGFLKEAKRRSFWQSRPARVGLGLLALLLGVALLLQWVVHERDRLVAQHPEITPWVASACQALGCRIGSVRRINDVAIESSNFYRRAADDFVFEMVLKNKADLPLAMPALELSLTDAREAVISRRVFLPGELPGAHAVLAAQASLPLSLSLSIAESGVTSMSGYRAVIFYP
jgi:predicted Zn finger-like uncharacterized protein